MRNVDDNEYDDDDFFDPEERRRDGPPPITADASIRDFFLLELARASGARKRRLERAVDDLRLCFEDVSDRILITSELATRDLERQFQPEGAAARVADAFALLHVLPLWLEDPRWHGDDLEDRRLRVQLTLPLARYVTRLPSFDAPNGGGCAFWNLDYAVRRARWSIREARREAAGGDSLPRENAPDLLVVKGVADLPRLAQGALESHPETLGDG